MEKTLFIHIGAHKTGTTALQRFLSENRNVLKENGYLYPGTDEAHHDLVNEVCSEPLAAVGKNAGSALRRCFDEIDRSGAEKIILSSELFENPGVPVGRIRDFLDNRFRVVVIYYIRRQDEKIESAYNESVRNSKTRYGKPVADFIREIASENRDAVGSLDMTERLINSDYYALLEPWRDTFGRENIIVRFHEKEQLAGDTYHDFLTTVGITTHGHYRFPEKRPNESLNWDLIEIIRICNKAFEDDLRLHRFLVRILTEINPEYGQKKQHILSPMQRREIIDRFEASNVRLAREYLGRTDGRLFYAPLPDPCEPVEPWTGLDAEKLVLIFTHMIFKLEKEQRKRRTALRESDVKYRVLKKIKTTGERLGLRPVMKYCYDCVLRLRDAGT